MHLRRSVPPGKYVKCCCLLWPDDRADQYLREHRVLSMMDPNVDDLEDYITMVRIWKTIRLIEEWQGARLRRRTRRAIGTEVLTCRY